VAEELRASVGDVLDRLRAIDKFCYVDLAKRNCDRRR